MIIKAVVRIWAFVVKSQLGRGAYTIQCAHMCIGGGSMHCNCFESQCQRNQPFYFVDVFAVVVGNMNFVAVAVVNCVANASGSLQ